MLLCLCASALPLARVAVMRRRARAALRLFHVMENSTPQRSHHILCCCSMRVLVCARARVLAWVCTVAVHSEELLWCFITTVWLSAHCREAMMDFQLPAAASMRARSPAGGDAGNGGQVKDAHDAGGNPTMSAANLVEAVIFEVQVELFEQLRQGAPSPKALPAFAPLPTPSRGPCLLPLESIVDAFVQTALG